MTDLNIRYGPSNSIFIDGQINPKLIIEVGCWYLCTDTAELFLGVDNGSELTLKRINDPAIAIPVDELALKSDITELKQEIIQIVKPDVEEVKTKVEAVLPKVEKVENELVPTINEVKTKVEEEIIPILPKVETIDTLKTWVENKEYLQDIDLEGYATESYVKNAITEAELNGKDVDLSGLATKDDIKNLANTAYVDEKVAEIVIPEVPTKVSELINDKNYISDIPNEYVTESELAAKGYLTEHQDLSSHALKSDIPTKVGQLENDVGYLTTVPSEYITETELSAKNYLTEHQSLAAYATKTYVENVVAENQPNLTKYALKTDIPDVSKFMTAVPDEYVTENELTAKGYLTEHQSLAEYAKKSDLFSKSYNDLIDTPVIPSVDGLATETYVDEAIANIDIPNTDLSNYYTKAETTSLVSEAVATIKPPAVDLSGYALTSDLELKADDIPFTTNRYVSNAVGNFASGESVRGLTVAELFAKLLGLSDVPKGVVENILTNKYGLYQFNDNIEVEYVGYSCTTFATRDEYASAPTESTFYQYTYINDEGKEITESGYQHHTRAQDFIYYMVMLPSSLIIGENVKVQAWSPSKNMWMDTTTVLEGDQTVIATNFADVGLEMPEVPDGYTMWVDFSDVNPGNKVRYIIIE